MTTVTQQPRPYGAPRPGKNDIEMVPASRSKQFVKDDQPRGLDLLKDCDFLHIQEQMDVDIKGILFITHCVHS